MQDIRAVLFDWGGVLIDNPASALMIYCAGALGVSVEDFTRVHDKHGQAFDKGWIPENQFWRQVCGDLGRPLPKTPSLWGQAFRAVYSPRREVFALAGGVRAGGCKTALLSNTEPPAMEFFLELRYDMFDVPIFSSPRGRASRRRESMRSPPEDWPQRRGGVSSSTTNPRLWTAPAQAWKASCTRASNRRSRTWPHSACAQSRSHNGRRWAHRRVGQT